MLEFVLVDFPSMTDVAPVLEQIGFGAVAGFVAGYALKKVGKVLAVALGLLFVAIQLLAYFGYVTVEWGRLQAEVEPLLGAESLGAAWRALLDVVTYNLPFAAAFVPSFVIGMKRG